MFARVSTIQAPTEGIDEGARLIQERVIPDMQRQRGYQGGYWMIDRQTGRTLVVTLWESQEALQASAAAAERSRTEATQVVGATVQRVEEYEVLAHG